MYSFRFILPAILSAFSAHAVTVKLYSGLNEDSCDPDDNFAQCSNIGKTVCCLSTSNNIWSVQGEGLYSEGIPEIILAFTHPDNAGCASSCGSGGGSNIECADCDGGNTQLGGGGWFDFGSKRETAVVSGSVYADTVGIYDVALGTHRLYRIGDGVPDHVVAELNEAVSNGTKVAGLTDNVVPYEAK